MDKEKIIEKVRKLLALGGSDNLHEAELALGRASDMMRKYQIKEAEIHKDEGGYKIEIQDHTIILPLGGCPWVRGLVFAIGNAFGCQSIILSYYPGTKRPSYKIKFYGDQADIATVRLLVQYAFETVCRFEKAEWLKVLSGEVSTTLTKTAYIHSYRIGVARGMCEVLQRIQNENERKGQKAINGENNTYALIFADKKALTAKAFKIDYPRVVRMSGSSSCRSGEGRSRGARDGKSVSFTGRGKNAGYLS